ncbi:MAG TPA: RNA ligase family protein [Phycisphaerae bacterium]|jgi:hypothetical protein
MRPDKPLGHKSYGTIGHLPGSRQGRDDVGIGPGQARICLEKARDRHDRIIVQEKLDGTNVAVANVGGQVIPLIRAGYPAVSSHYEQHRLFAVWVFERLDLFAFLKPGERLAGEWLAQAHGTRYQLRHDPFVAFDIMRNGHERAPFDEFVERIAGKLTTPTMLHTGGPCAIAAVMAMLGEFGFHGALDPVEGAVWRVERQGRIDFLAKYVRPDKIDGCYLPELSGGEPIWNWRP